MTSIIVMTTIGEVPKGPQAAGDDISPAPPGFCWRFVPDGTLAVQFRAILQMDPRAVVVRVGADDAVHRAAKLIARLLGSGLQIVIAIGEAHDPCTEAALRQAGALYICAGEAQERLGEVLESILRLRPRSIEVKTVHHIRKLNMDAG
jgi:hypothetical protein